MGSRCCFAAACLCAALLSGCPMASTDVHPLVGQQAPTFTATMLGDKPFDLAECQGKIVILDFWATWCPPCRAALPVLIEVASQYRDRGVEFYAVDVGEHADVVREFFDATMLEAAVVLDTDGAISETYKVEYLPQTVVIDRDARVAFVHVGSSDDLRKELSSELDSLLSGSAAAQAAAVKAGEGDTAARR